VTFRSQAPRKFGTGLSICFPFGVVIFIFNFIFTFKVDQSYDPIKRIPPVTEDRVVGL